MPGPSVMVLCAQRPGRRVRQARMILYLPLRAVARAIQTMSRPALNQLPRSKRVRGLLASLCAACCVLPAAVWAGRPVHVYEVDIEGQSAPALQNALRQALVRATGRRESADDPAFASVIAEAPKYPQELRKRPARRAAGGVRCPRPGAGNRYRGPQCVGSRAPVHAGGSR